MPNANDKHNVIVNREYHAMSGSAANAEEKLSQPGRMEIAFRRLGMAIGAAPQIEYRLADAAIPTLGLLL